MISGTISCVYIKPDNESKSDSSSGFFRKADSFFPASFFGVRMKLKVLIHNEGQLGKLQAVHNQLRHQVLGPLG